MSPVPVCPPLSSKTCHQLSPRRRVTVRPSQLSTLGKEPASGTSPGMSALFCPTQVSLHLRLVELGSIIVESEHQ